MNISDFIKLLGGVALFLFGMALMGDGLKKVAGDKLELVLYKLSGTPLKGLLLGTGVTAVIQSSSATSVMVVGFVNAGMMKVRQAIPVIMGAIIGTSITGWIICLSELGGNTEGLVSLLSTDTISAFAAIAGILLRMIPKKKVYKNIGDILLGFSVLMFGMKTMSGSVSGLKDSPAFIRILTGFKNPLLGILAGAAFTAVLQSASATVGILQALSSTGAITFDIALPIILGIAVGASVPVVMSSIGSNTSGKRAAFSYLLIEISRTVLFAAVFYILNLFIRFSFMSSVMNMVSIALLNTVFRVSTVILLAPFVSQIEKILKKLFKRSEEEIREYRELNRLEPRFLSYPPLAIEQTRLMMNTMSELSRKSVALAGSLLNVFDEKVFEEVNRLEGTVDKYEDKIGSYLMQLTAYSLTPAQNAAATEYLHVLSDFERMSDYALNIAKSAQEVHDKQIEFTAEGRAEIASLLEAVSMIADAAVKGFTDLDTAASFSAGPLEETVDLLCQQYKNNHIDRLRKGECQLTHGYVFNDLLTGFERIAGHSSNIAFTSLEVSEDTLGNHAYEKDLKAKRAEDYSRMLAQYKARFGLTE